MALHEIKNDMKRKLRCAVQSYGQVQQFFLSHPCRKLDQLLFAVSDTDGNIIAGSVMWVRIPSSTIAAQFKHLDG
jgi:hypothetical protein